MILGRTVLVCSAYHGQNQAIRLLIKQGALINQKTPSGKSAIHYAQYQNHEETVQILLRNGATL
jgi:ankyrin repeat protein